MDVDFNQINENIYKENLDIRLIRIIYENLNELEVKELLEYQGGQISSPGKVLSNYPEDRDPLFKEKATGVIYLGGA